MRRVVITGSGAVSALGVGAEPLLEAMRAGRSGIGALEFSDVERLSVRIGAQLKGWDEARFGRQAAALDRFAQFALVAAQEAVAQAGLELTEAEALRAGAVIGTAGGGNSTINDAFKAVFAAGKDRVHPFTVPKLMNNAACSQISMAHGLMGPVFSVATACASSNHAIGLAYQLIRGGVADVMLAGGAESMLNFGGLKAWEGLRVLSPDGCKPFSAARNGMVQGEGAGVFVLEDYARARARGADILCEIKGFAMGADASDLLLPSSSGAVRAMRGALDGLSGAVGYINAHGTGTLANDRSEAQAIVETLGDQVPVSSTKPIHGHAIGAAGGLELFACLLALREGVIAPNLNYETPDPDCAIAVVSGEARQARVDLALSNAFAFGGLNAVLALGNL